MSFAFVIPFCDKDTEVLFFNLMRWSKFNPCTAQYSSARAQVSLFFIFNTSSHALTELNEAKIKQLVAPFSDAFVSIHIQNKFLTSEQNHYPFAPAVTFFETILSEEFSQFECIFYCEADCVPVREAWLHAAVNEMIDCEKNDYWIKAPAVVSEEWGRLKMPLARKIHMNGNGFFRAKSGIARNLFAEVYQLLREEPTKRVGYDVFLFNHVFNDKEWKYLIKFLQHVRWTGFVQNFYRYDVPANYKPDEACFFMHGRSAVEFLRQQT